MNLVKQDLSHINFNGDVLINANLTLSHCESATFKRADLSFAHLVDTDLSGARFDGALMEYASLVRTIMTTGNFDSANMRKVNLSDAKFVSCNMRYVNFRDAVFKNTELLGCDLTGAILINADMRGANLTNTNLDEAILLGADLSGAILDKAILTNCKVTINQLKQAASTIGMVMSKKKNLQVPAKEELLFMNGFDLDDDLLFRVTNHAVNLGLTPREFVEGLLLNGLKRRVMPAKSNI